MSGVDERLICLAPGGKLNTSQKVYLLEVSSDPGSRFIDQAGRRAANRSCREEQRVLVDGREAKFGALVLGCCERLERHQVQADAVINEASHRPRQLAKREKRDRFRQFSGSTDCRCGHNRVDAAERTGKRAGHGVIADGPAKPVIPQAGGEDLPARAAEVGWFLIQQYGEEEVVIDDYVHGAPLSGELGFAFGHLGGQLGVAPGLADGVAKKGPLRRGYSRPSSPLLSSCNHGNRLGSEAGDHRRYRPRFVATADWLCYKSHMTSVGVRELRQRASELLRLVEQGETIEITDRGRPVARLTPIPEGSPLEQMYAAGEIEAASATLEDLPEPLVLPDNMEMPSAALGRLRRDER